MPRPLWAWVEGRTILAAVIVIAAIAAALRFRRDTRAWLPYLVSSEEPWRDCYLDELAGGRWA